MGGSGPSVTRPGQTVSVDEGHRIEVVPFVLADFEDRHDTGMVKRSGGLSLLVETAKLRAVASWPVRIILSATVRLRLICLAL